jgi:adenosine deaminase CECR1
MFRVMNARTAPLLAGVIVVLALPSCRAPQFAIRWEQFKTRLSNENLYRLLWALPKGGDIHNHHEYSVPVQFWLEGAARLHYYTRFRVSACEKDDPLLWLNLREDTLGRIPACVQHDFTPVDSLTPAQQAAWIAALTLDGDEEKEEFFERIVRRLGNLERDPELMADALVVAQEQLQAENAVYLETQADPRFFQRLSQDAGADVFRRRLKQADSVRTDVAVRMQVSTVRFLKDAEKDLADGFAFVHRNHDLWAGVNLVGREDNPAGRASRFESSFRSLRAQYPDVQLSLHAGESAGSDSHVAETIALGASRIGHGTNAHLDARSMDLLRGGRYLVEVSLVSNQVLGYVPDLRRHPLPEYLRQGIPVCLNTDDRGTLNSNLTDEYFAAVSLFNLTWDEIVRMGRWSLEFSFAEPKLKAQLLRRYESKVADFVNAYSSSDWETTLSGVKPQRSGSTERVFRWREAVRKP